MKFRVVVHAAEVGGYWAEIPAFPGLVAVGASLDEIKENARQAVVSQVLRSE
ncbi:type II toxin-antitoxin system HicB family antitoxin [Sulfurifustis variabilis]|uniref:type II toxin-antitoxin system HicB family antitoxin n=1 Tax=Sulfurifustis variabilis TaxID=1675686 RepID=UPI000BBB1052|nr:type II toxin-antitoxin system HicB family antitoxin [Sulfurifustis variabilis]